MAEPHAVKLGDAELVFAAYNTHTAHCGGPPRLRNIDNPRLYHGYFENSYGEQFVFTFDEATGTGTIWGGDLDWGNAKAFSRALVEEALRETQRLAWRIVVDEHHERPVLPIIDEALALGRLTGVTGKEEIIWLRACLQACNLLEKQSGDHPHA